MLVEIVVLGAFLLVAVAVYCLASSVVQQNRRALHLMQANERMVAAVMAATEKVVELSRVDYIDRTLRQRGIVGFIGSTATERIRSDIEETMKHLGLDEDEAIEYLTRGTVTPKAQANGQQPA